MSALATRLEDTPSADKIIRELEQAEHRPDKAVRAAVLRASEIVLAVTAAVEVASTGASLPRSQENLLFWGIHALAAARRTELYRPLIKLIRDTEEAELDRLLGDATTETLSGIIISVFDGDVGPLIEACSNPDVNGFARWNLIGALARLTFDGAIPRDATLAFLDRFERDRSLNQTMLPWQGWQDAITLLGLEEMRDRLIAACREGRFEQDDKELEFGLNEITLARNLAGGDASLFVKKRLHPIDDPLDALAWVSDATDAESENDDSVVRDPAADTALNGDEIAWLRACLASRPSSVQAMTLEQVDGYYCALAMHPHWTRVQESLSDIFDPSDDTQWFDTDEQAERAARLLGRHVQTIVARLDASYAHVPLLEGTSAPRGQPWAKGFIKGMQVAGADWQGYIENDDVCGFLKLLLALQLADGDEEKGIRMTSEWRADLVPMLPMNLLGLYAAVQLEAERARTRPATSTKVGRNEPCPCGSGKKFKRCCGSIDKRTFN